MKLRDSIVISGDYDRIFELAADVEDWGRILPHYRYVRVLRQDGNRKLVRMSAWRDFIPVTWSAVETVYTGTRGEPGRITFHHVRGMVKGMDVEWSFKVRNDRRDVLVTISHNLAAPPFPVKLLGGKLTEIIVGKGFISNIAGKTLKRVKHLAEGET
jgi:ribosome-associated toxin RatA of RatAB toxin-antitoxin module